MSREQVFDAIDEGHQGHAHMGQERTWTYCRSKYFNVTQQLVRIYCETCVACCKKNVGSNTQKDSLGWKLLSPRYCLGVARSNSITVTAVILSLTAVIFVRVTKLLSPKNWTVIYSITVLYYCPTVLLLLCYCRTVLLSITVYIA